MQSCSLFAIEQNILSSSHTNDTHVSARSCQHNSFPLPRVKAKVIKKIRTKLERKLRQFDKFKRGTGDSSWPIKIGSAA